MQPKLLTTIRAYSLRLFFGDTVAGITVALVALPLSIAIAIASGAGPTAGLVTAIVGGFLISLLGGSRVQIGGPTGAFIVVVYGVIEQHGFDGLLLEAGSLTNYLAMPALAALLIVTAWVMSEPHRWRERMRLEVGDRTLLFLTMALTVVSDLTIAIAVGTVAGLARRLVRKDVEPEDWAPSDRSQL